MAQFEVKCSITEHFVCTKEGTGTTEDDAVFYFTPQGISIGKEKKIRQSFKISSN